MYDEVLLPVDADSDPDVVEHVGELAAWADASVTLLHVADTTRDSLAVAGTDVVDVLVREGESIVEAAAEPLADLAVEFETDVVQGGPAETITDYAERYDYDLVATATHGRQGVSRYLVGSVAERVVRLSSVPVLTARMRPDERLAFPYDSVLLPTDGSEGAAEAVDHALSLAGALDATVHVLSVVSDSLLGLDAGEAREAGERAATGTVEEVRSTAAGRGVDGVQTHVVHGGPAESIVGAVDEFGVDAVVMGTTGRRGVERVLLGSVAARTVRTAPVPVLTVGND